MTALAALLARVRPAGAWLAARPRLALVLLVVVLALLLTCSWNRARSAEDRAAAAETREKRAEEAAKIEAAGFTVAVQRSREGMQAQLAALLGERDMLAGEVERFQAASPKSRPVAILQASTAPGPAAGEPRPPAPSAPCLVAPGDLLELQVGQVTLATSEGNEVALGEVEAWRTKPEPRTRLYAGTFASGVTRLVVEEPVTPKAEERAPRWGAGAWVGVGRDGWSIGPAIALPPARLGPLSLEAVIGGGLGAGGTWQGGATGVVRW